MMEWTQIIWMMYGMCAGVILTSIATMLATYRDYIRNYREDREKLFDIFPWEEILYKDSRSYIGEGEIILPEV